MFASALSFLAGDCLVQLLPALPSLWPWSFVVGGLLVISALIRWPVAVWGLAGFAWAWSHAALLLARDLPSALEGKDLEVRGFVASLPESIPRGSRFLLDLLPQRVNVADPLPRRLELTWYDATAQPAAGELWKFTVRLRRRRGFANPGGYDYEAQLFREGIGATGYIREAGENRRLSAPGFRYPVLRLRGFLAQRLEQALPDSPMLGIVQGLAVGEQQQMTPEQWRVFAATGTSHLLAISGLHIAMVAALSAALGGLAIRLPRMQQRRFTASDGRAVGCILGAVVYTALAGFGVPAQRTLVMLCIYCGARLLRRELKVTQGLALSLFAVLLLDPFAPLSIGAWLSFGAVGAILWLLAGRLHAGRRSNLRQRLLEFLKVQWAVTIGLFPLLLLSFGAVSLVSPLVNLVAIPFFTLLIVPAVLLGTAAMLLWAPLGGLLLSWTAGLLEAVWPWFAFSASFEHSVWHLPQAPAWASMLLLVGACVIIAPGFLATRVAGMLLCLPALLWRPDPVGESAFRLTLLDVGQGLAVVVQTRTHTLLYYAGPAFQSGRDTGEMVVLPFVHALGVRRIDTAIVSHGDLDHVGGMASVLAGMRVDRVLASPSVHLKDFRPVPCLKGMHWQWDGVEFALLHPAEGDGPQSDNNASCVLRIEGRGGSALLLGDIERAGEQELVEAGLAPTSIVVAAHHGSRTSSTAPLVEGVQARYVLFGTGYRNRRGFPRPEVLERWREAGAVTYTTAASGAIEVVVQAASIEVPRAYREHYRRYWHTDVVDEND